MQIIQDIFVGSRYDPILFLNLERFAGEASDYNLALGYINFEKLNIFPDNSVVFLCVEEPNGFFGAQRFLCHKYLHKIFKVLTLCPFTTEWSNITFAGHKWVTVPWPFNEEFILEPAQKKINVIYSGSINNGLIETLAAIQLYHGCFVSHEDSDMVTHKEVSYLEKLKLYSQSKISVIHNLLFPDKKYVDEIKKLRPAALYENKSLAQVASGIANPVMPQIKSRLFEAAFCRSLILCRRDPWNLIENYFEPGKEFIYYDEGQLLTKIGEILSHYDDYAPVIESAFSRACANYTTQVFFNKYLKI